MKQVRCTLHRSCNMHSCPHHGLHTKDDTCTTGTCSLKAQQVTCDAESKVKDWRN